MNMSLTQQVLSLKLASNEVILMDPHEITTDVVQGNILSFSSLKRLLGIWFEQSWESQLGYVAMEPHMYALNLRSEECSQKEIVFLKLLGFIPWPAFPKDIVSLFTVPFSNHHQLSQAICFLNSSITSCGTSSCLQGALWSSRATAGQQAATCGLWGLRFLRCFRGWPYIPLVSEDILKPHSQTEICTLEAKTGGKEISAAHEKNCAWSCTCHGGLLAYLLVNSKPSLQAEHYLSWNCSQITHWQSHDLISFVLGGLNHTQTTLLAQMADGMLFFQWLVSWYWMMLLLLNLSDFTSHSLTKSQLLARPSCQEQIKAGFFGIWSPDALRKCSSRHQVLAGRRTIWLSGKSMSTHWKHDRNHINTYKRRSLCERNCSDSGLYYFLNLSLLFAMAMASMPEDEGWTGEHFRYCFHRSDFL